MFKLLKNIKDLHLITTSILLVCTFIILSLCSYAWFSINRHTTSTGMQFVALSDDVTLNYAVYKYDQVKACGADVTNTATAFDLPTYDSVILSRNKNTQLIIKLVISGDIDLSAMYLNIICTDDHLDTMSISNIINFNCDYIDFVSDSPDIIYDVVASYFSRNVDNCKRFVNDDIKSTKITFPLNEFASYSENNTLTLFIQMNYDAELISKIGGFSTSDFDVTLNYVSDLVKIELTGGAV